jgi:predicted nucleotidyltransferase
MPIKVVFDTNILLSGIGWYGKPYTCLELARNGVIEGVACRELLDELSEKLDTKLEFSAEQIIDTIADLTSFLSLVKRGQKMVKTLSNIENKAVEEFKRKVIDRFRNAEFILFGSKARGEADEYSDIDILILLEDEPNISTEEEIIDIGFELEIKYDVVLGIITHSKTFWDSRGILMPIHKEIEKDGIQI